MHVSFDPSKESWTAFFNNQTGSGKPAAYPYFAGKSAWQQRGLGFFTALQTLIPMAKAAGAYLAREGLNVGGDILKDVEQGTPLMESIKKQVRQRVSSGKIQKGGGKRGKSKKQGHFLIGKRLKRDLFA